MNNTSNCTRSQTTAIKFYKGISRILAKKQQGEENDLQNVNHTFRTRLPGSNLGHPGEHLMKLAIWEIYQLLLRDLPEANQQHKMVSSENEISQRGTGSSSIEHEWGGFTLIHVWDPIKTKRRACFMSLRCPSVCPLQNKKGSCPTFRVTNFAILTDKQ